MKTFIRTYKPTAVFAGLLSLFMLSLGLSARGQVLTNFFTGDAVVTNGVIDTFFVPGTTNPLPGVCLGAFGPGSGGFSTDPVNALNTKDGLFHPSGFNPRRAISAYNPTLHGGTVFVGIDLAGGTGSPSNPNFNDGVVPVRTGSDGILAIRPFDADGNGEPETIGRTAGGAIVGRCSEAANNTESDVIDCANAARNGSFSDRIDPEVTESYFAQVVFGDGTFVKLVMQQDALSVALAGGVQGRVRLSLTQTPGKTFGGYVSAPGAFINLVTNTLGIPKGFDVLFAITNVNTNVTFCARLSQSVTVKCSSDSDGVGNGEPDRVTSCTYVLPEGIVITKNCPPTNGVPGGVIGFSGFVTNTGQVPLTNVTVFNNQPAPNTLVTNYPSIEAGGFRFYSGTEPVPFDVCAITNTVSVRGTNICTGGVVTNFATTNCPVQPTPIIRVFKQVVCYSNLCEPFSTDLTAQKTATGVSNAPNCPAFCYRITITNAGNVTLTDVSVSDNRLNLAGCAFPTTLARGGQPGSSASCIIPGITHCANSTNIVTATGSACTNIAGVITNTTVTARDTNRVTIIPIGIDCRLLVSTNNGVTFDPYSSPNCPRVLIGSNYIVRLVVTNTGQHALQNVTITDTGATPLCFTSPRNIGTLAVGGFTNIHCTNLCTALITNNFAVSVVGQASKIGTNVCDVTVLGSNIVARSSCETCVICEGTPCIRVFKNIACLVCTNIGGTNLTFPCDVTAGPFSKVAYGVSRTNDPVQCPAFCYQIIVTNCGEVGLRDVRLDDDRLTDPLCSGGPSGIVNPLVGFPSTLSVGQSVTNYYRHDWLVDTTNTVTARAQSVADASARGAVTNSDFAIARIRPANIACAKLLSVNGGPWTNRVNLTVPPDAFATQIVWAVFVTNTGLANLENVVVTEDPLRDGLACGPLSIAVPIAGGILPPSTFVGPIYLCTNTYTECVNTNIANQVIVTAQAASDTNCVCDLNGSNITVRAECDASFNQTCEVPQACRVTGGGRQDYPLVYPNTDVRYVTHGGQVGAPVGEQTCVVTTNFWLGNPCIHGRWTHVRHEKGGLRGNFHARFYDTLTCACLDTNLVAGFYGPGTTTNGLCNPGDRGRGPEPRPAPANKIVFTGVGDWADPNGRRAPRATLFRVDIEDRSEPGGSHPKGSRPPADRYRIRIWVLSTSELAQLNGAGPDPYLLSFRNAISACNGLTAPDGAVDGAGNRVSTANGTIVFGVRRPDIDDGGELERGNHQIHPMIKRCDPNNPTGPGLPKP